MSMTPRLRRFALLAHITFSVGWLGAVLAYLALAVSGLTGGDTQMVRAAYLVMEVIGWSVIVPLSIAALTTGLVQSLGTEWGLFRHYWILAKFFLTAVGTIILLVHMQTAVSPMAKAAAATATLSTDFNKLRLSILIHAGGGLLILLAATVLSVYKPWGRTPYGRRKQNGQVNKMQSDSGSTTSVPWGRYVLFGIIGLALLFVVFHLTRGGLHRH